MTKFMEFEGGGPGTGRETQARLSRPLSVFDSLSFVYKTIMYEMKHEKKKKASTSTIAVKS